LCWITAIEKVPASAVFKVKLKRKSVKFEGLFGAMPMRLSTGMGYETGKMAGGIEKFDHVLKKFRLTNE
jgi:hypothetical protein